MPTTTLLGELALPLAQCIDVEDRRALVPHAVPGMDGDLVQEMGRRSARVAVTGVVAGPEARDGLEQLRERLRAAEPVDFAADIATATRVTRVLVEKLDVRELAGRPERFEYAFLLREYVPPPPPQTEVPPETPPEPAVDTGVLEVEVAVEGEPDFDMARVAVTAEAGGAARTLSEREGNVWAEADAPVGEQQVRARVAEPEMAGAAAATVRAGQTTPVRITLAPAQGIARAFVVSFRFDSAFVEPCMRAALRRAAAYARANASQRFLVVGHTDKTGSDAYNQSLSERRARAVAASILFNDGPDAAVAEWTALRQPRTGTGPTLADRWGAREYQQMLQQLGDYPGQIDGDHGPKTDEAVRAFRCRKGLPPGTAVDDAVWAALIRDYLADDPPSIARDRLLPNCAGTKLEWIGCGEEDPVSNTPSAHRPNRRVEVLFTTAAALPCRVAVPDTWHLPAPGRTPAEWCLGPAEGGRACFLQRQPPPAPPRLLVEPAEPGQLAAAGRVLKEVERADGTVEQLPAANEALVLITPTGEFLQGEAGSGEPTPARTGADGSFTFAGKPRGVYALEIRREVVARLLDAPGSRALGPTVCRPLLADGERLDVLILRDPVLREIRLPVIVHLMTALHPVTRAVRTCLDASQTPPVRFDQRTARDEAAVRALLVEANRIWGRARIRFEVRDVLREAFATPRTECAVTEDERNDILVDSATPNAVNLYLFGNVEAHGEAGVHVVGHVVDGAGSPIRTLEGIATGDRVQLELIQGFPPVQRIPTVPEQEVILAHELGHYLTLEHVDGGETAETRNRLMLRSEVPENRRLVAAEVARARASDNAAKDCVPLALRVAGAVRFGGEHGHRWIALRDAAAPPVTVDAVVPPHLAGAGVTLTGGDAGAGPLQRVVPRTALARREVIARMAPAGGRPAETFVAVHVVDFTVEVDGATRVGGPQGTTFVALRDPAATVTVRAAVFPEPAVIPHDLATFSAGDGTDDPLRRILPRAAAGSTEVRVTVAGVTRTVTIVVSELALNVTGAAETAPGDFAAAREDGEEVVLEAVFTPPVPEEEGLVAWAGGQEGAGPRFRVVSRQAVGVEEVTAQVGADERSATITVFDFTLDVQGATRLDGPAGTRFVTFADPTPLTVVADVTPPGVLPGVVTWTGATEIPGLQPPQALARRAATGEVTVSAEMAGETRTVTIFVVAFRLEVEGAAPLTTAAGNDFVAIVDDAATVRVRAVVEPEPAPVPADLVAWTSSDGSETADGPLARLVPRTPRREMTVTGTVAGEARTVRIFVSELTLAVAGAAELPPAGSGEHVALAAAGQRATVTATVDPAPVPVPADLVTWGGDPTTAAGPVARTVPLDAAGPPVRVEATVAGVTRAVRLSVVDFALEVTGATAVPAGGDTFFAGVDAGQVVTVEARVTPPPPVALPPDFVTWTGGDPVAGEPLRRTVPRDAGAVTQVRAEAALLGGAARTATVHVFTLTLEVEPPAIAIGPAGGGEFVALADPAPLTAVAVLAPAPTPVPAGLVSWTGATPDAADPLRAAVARSAAGPVQVQAAAAGATSAATVHLVTFTLEVTDATPLPAGGTEFFALEAAVGDVTVHARFLPVPPHPLPPNTVSWTGGTAVGADPLARTVARAAAASTPVQAQALGGTRSVTVHVVRFEIAEVQNAVQIGARSSTLFATTTGAGDVTLVGRLTPAIAPVPAGLVTWTGAAASGADPLRATVPRAAAVRAAATATALGTAFARDVAVLADPSLAGAFLVGEHEYDTGTMTVTVGLGSFTVRRRALVRYPADAAGVDTPVAAARPTYPLVFILHGNHRRLDDLGNFVESFRGHEPLARHLASHGYVAVSIDGDDINARPGSFGVLIEERGALIREHVGLMAGRNAGDPLFGGRLDTARIGLIGHSRGGEGVVAAQQQNVTGSLGLGIGAVISIAPTNFEDFALTGAPFLLLYGTSDGDVNGQPDGGPFILYERAAPPKAMWFAYGACHNRFSTNPDWNDAVHIDNDDARLLSLAQHQDIAKGFSFAFLERHLRADGPFDLFFAHDRRPDSVAALELFPQYRDGVRQVVDDFEQPPANPAAPLPDQLANRATTNTLGIAATGSGLALPSPMLPPAPTAFADPLTEAPLTHDRLESFVHLGNGLLAAWTSAAATYETALGGLDASAFQVLSFRVTQRLGSPHNPAGTAQDFVVALVDSASRVAELRVGATAVIPAPFVRHDHAAVHAPALFPRFVDARPDSPDLSKSALRTVRLRLDDFVAATPQLDLSQLATVRFAFRERATGELAIDDLEFSL